MPACGIGYNHMSKNNSTDFFASVYTVVAQIPRGRVMSYGQIARVLGAPRAAQHEKNNTSIKIKSFRPLRRKLFDYRTYSKIKYTCHEQCVHGAQRQQSLVVHKHLHGVAVGVALNIQAVLHKNQQHDWHCPN